MPNSGEMPPETNLTKADPTETDEDLRKIMGRPAAVDDGLNEFENIEMTDNEKIAEEWIKENGIKEGTELIIKKNKALVTSVDFERRVLILDSEKSKNVSYPFEQIGSEMEESKNTIRIKESE